ncbi:hypothetical protein BSL84_30505 [Streptomyces sp. TN58]|nr:hypothetical protein BSL84_30505 [Streptomyces sp. TN58]
MLRALGVLRRTWSVSLAQAADLGVPPGFAEGRPALLGDAGVMQRRRRSNAAGWSAAGFCTGSGSRSAEMTSLPWAFGR